jgi:hypothetical protein
MTLYAIFLCVRLTHPDPTTGTTEIPCSISGFRDRFETIATCHTYMDALGGAYTRHDAQGRYFLPDYSDGTAVSWNECRMTDQPPPPPPSRSVAKLTLCTRHPGPDAGCHDVALPRVMPTLDECDAYAQSMVGHGPTPPYTHQFDKRFYVNGSDDTFYQCGWGKVE